MNHAIKVVPALLAAVPLVARAHDPLTSVGAEQAASLLSASLLLVLWSLYCYGSARRRPRLAQALCFHGAVLLSGLTIFGPLDSWAETDAAAHMTQHMLMMLVIAPLWVLSQPLPQLRASTVGETAALLSRPLMRLTPHPLWAAWIHGAVLWFWHLPRFYVLALESPWWHVTEHLCFLLTAALFAWSVLKCTRRSAPQALLAVLFTLMHTGFLGALLTFARAPLYVSSLTASLPSDQLLASQQLAGLLMWALGAVPYLLAALWITQRWLRQLWVYR